MKDPQSVERFHREARAAPALNHPNICTIHEVGVNGHPYIAMEYLEGSTLKHAIGDRPLEIDKLLASPSRSPKRWTRRTRRKVVHRDIKPADIFITVRGHAKVLDFGLAQVQTPGATAAEDEAMRTVYA